MLLDCFPGHALADVVSWPCRCCHVVAVALPVSAMQCLCRVFAVLFLCLRCVFTVSLPWLSRALLCYCCDFAISLLRPCRWLAVPITPWFIVIRIWNVNFARRYKARESCRHESWIYNVIFLSSHRMPHICCDEQVHVVLPAIWQGPSPVRARRLPTPSHTTRWRGNQMTCSACSRVLLPPACQALAVALQCICTSPCMSHVPAGLRTCNAHAMPRFCLASLCCCRASCAA